MKGTLVTCVLNMFGKNASPEIHAIMSLTTHLGEVPSWAAAVGVEQHVSFNNVDVLKLECPPFLPYLLRDCSTSGLSVFNKLNFSFLQSGPAALKECLSWTPGAGQNRLNLSFFATYFLPFMIFSFTPKTT